MFLYQKEDALRRRLETTNSTLRPFFDYVLQLPRGADGFCPSPWKPVLLAMASNHGCAGGLVKVPTLVRPVLSKLAAGGLLEPDDSVVLVRYARRLD